MQLPVVVILLICRLLSYFSITISQLTRWRRQNPARRHLGSLQVVADNCTGLQPAPGDNKAVALNVLPGDNTGITLNGRRWRACLIATDRMGDVNRRR